MAEQEQNNTQRPFTLSRGQDAVLQKVGDIMLSFAEAIAYTGWSRTYFNQHPEIPRTSAPVRFRLSDLDRIIDARTINPLPNRSTRGAA